MPKKTTLKEQQDWKDFINGFYGYGEFARDGIWFVLMEEKSEEDELKNRVSKWICGGRKPLEDLPTYSWSVGVGSYFDLPPKTLQQTWEKVIICLLAARTGLTIKQDDRKDFQRLFLGREGGDHCILDLMPIASARDGDWPCSEKRPSTDELSRQTCLDEIVLKRIEFLRRAIKFSGPRAVVFFGQGYGPRWREVAGVSALDWKQIDRTGQTYEVTQADRTLYFIVNFPRGGKPDDEYYETIGKLIYSPKLLQQALSAGRI
jgi:hypothetical protein